VVGLGFDINMKELKEYAYDKEGDLDLGRLKGETPELDLDMIQRRYNTDFMFQTYFSLNYTTKLLAKFEWQYKHNQNVIINSWGQPRSSKTYNNISLTLQTSYPLENADTIFFKLEDLNEYLPHLKPYDTVVHDEHDEAFGVGTKRLELEYVRMIETLGKRKINWFITSPIPRAQKHSYFLIQALRLFDYKWHFKIKGEDEGGLSYSELTDNRKNTIGHLRMVHPRLLNNNLIEEYEKKKNDFLDTVQRKSGKDYLADMAHEIMDNEKFKDFEEIVKKALKKRYKGLKYNDVYAIVNEMHPELRGNIEAKTIANAIIHYSIAKRGWMPRG
jgi:hypothetical protein